jgi:tetratricopeptide (TPR) repeat protein
MTPPTKGFGRDIMGFSTFRKTPILASAILGLVVVLAAAAFEAHLRSSRSRHRTELEQVRQTMARGRYAAARRSLAELSASWPGSGEVALLLGQCDEALGEADRAIQAWERIPSGDPSFPQAAEARGHLLINLGRYRQAETFLLPAAGDAPPAGRALILRTLARLFRVQGRMLDVHDALVAAWQSTADPAPLLKELWQNDSEPLPAEGWKLMLDRADGQDDRVWLARCRHAIVTARYDDARQWLDRCLERRPDDLAVWRACLDLAVATEDLNRFWKAADRLPAAALRPWEIASSRAWLAAHAADRQLQRTEWAGLLDLRPASPQTLERLAELAAEASDTSSAGELLRRKGEIDRAWDHLRRLVILEVDFRSQAADMVRLSAILGRPFDQNAWYLIAAADGRFEQNAVKNTEQARAFCGAESDRSLARLIEASRPVETTAGDRLASQLGDLPRAVVGLGDAGTSRRSAAGSNRPPLEFIDEASSAGLNFVFDSARSPLWLLPESLSGGIGLIDFDGDGWLDVYCVQGGPAGDRLFRNQRDGGFRDATKDSRVAVLTGGLGYGMGIAVGDYDNDGHPDLFLTRLDRYALLRNRGDGTFEDATARVGLAGPRDNPTSAAFADLDNDGDLDLYVCHYARWDPRDPPRCQNEKGEPHYCDPAKYESAVDHVFRNDGGRFADVTSEAGFTDPDGHGLGVVAGDYDGDGRMDLFVANDGSANFLFHNLGSFRFEEVGLVAGTAANAEGGFRAGMGVVAADFSGRGRLDFLVNNLNGEGSTFYQNLGQGLFADRSSASGILQATRYLTGFGVVTLDPANDGRIHMATANGHVNDFRPFYPFSMPARLYEVRPGGGFEDVSERSGSAWAVPHLGRGLAAGDVDNDGLVDLVIVSQNEPLVYLHNRTARPGCFITFQLEGTVSNRDGIGAVVTIETLDGKRSAQSVGGGSYLAASDRRLHFGLGTASAIRAVTVRWPSGRSDRWQDLTAGAAYRLREGDPAARPIQGLGSPRTSPRG